MADIDDIQRMLSEYVANIAQVNVAQEFLRGGIVLSFTGSQLKELLNKELALDIYPNARRLIEAVVIGIVDDQTYRVPFHELIGLVGHGGGHLTTDGTSTVPYTQGSTVTLPGGHLPLAPPFTPEPYLPYAPPQRPKP
jgi:hypothetical protein